ncbi:MAG: PEP-utilizing enzyme [Patescibacteria group bacterium]
MKKILSGLAASCGRARGKARIIRGIKDLKKFKKGDILVAKITDPTMVQMMAKASAIVCDIGGMTSHPAIVSREMGIPCIVGTKSATKKLKNGVKVLVDGDKGEVYLVR